MAINRGSAHTKMVPYGLQLSVNALMNSSSDIRLLDTVECVYYLNKGMV